MRNLRPRDPHAASVPYEAREQGLAPVRSEMPAAVAAEILRRKDWTPEGGWWTSGCMAFNEEDVEAGDDG